MGDQRDELREDLRERIAFDFRAGVLLPEEIVAGARAHILEVLGANDDALMEEAASWIERGADEQRARERGWTARTANDELDTAFDLLAAGGIIGLQAAGTTVQHAWALAYETAAADAPHAHGAVFYHFQDLERVVDGEGLALAFCAFDPSVLASLRGPNPPSGDGKQMLTIQPRMQNVDAGDAAIREAARAVGAEIVAVLRQVGFDPQWDGSPRTRIEISPFDWAMRRHTQAPPRTEPLAPRPAQVETAPPPVCPDCEGRGWLPPLVPGDFSDFCWCKGGKRPRPAAPEPVASAEPTPAPTTPSELVATSPGPPPLGALERLRKWLRGD